MTLHDYAELCEYWADHPPAHVIAAAKIGLKPRRRGRPNMLPGAQPPGEMRDAPSDLGALLRLAPNGIARAENLNGAS